MAYDKTIFKPAEITTLGRYRFSVVEDTEETSGQSDASLSASEPSTEPADAPSQFDLGDFSNLKPAPKPGEDADNTEDELPLLGGPAAEQ